MNETIWQPVILSAEVTPNPATTGRSLVIRVLALDVFGAEQTEMRLVGEWYSGEV